MSVFRLNLLWMLLACGAFAHPSGARAATFSADSLLEFDRPALEQFSKDNGWSDASVVLEKSFGGKLSGLDGTVEDSGDEDVSLDVNVQTQFTCLWLRGRRSRLGGMVFARPVPQEEVFPIEGGASDGESEFADSQGYVMNDGLLSAGFVAFGEGPIGITPVHGTFATNWSASGSGSSSPAYSFGDGGVGGGGGYGGGGGFNSSGPFQPPNQPDPPDPPNPPNASTPEPASAVIWGVAGLLTAGIGYSRRRFAR